MDFLRIFWDAAVALDPAATSLHEGARFPLCKRDALRSAFVAAGLKAVDVAPITIPTAFAGFDDFWAPFVDGPGPAPTHVSSLCASDRDRLADRLRETLVGADDHPINLHAQAWAAKGFRA
jgi:hypothetical protein